MDNFLQKIFSVKNENCHKVFTFLGLKFQFFMPERAISNDIKILQAVLTTELSNINNNLTDLKNNYLNSQESILDDLSAIKENSYVIIERNNEIHNRLEEILQNLREGFSNINTLYHQQNSEFDKLLNSISAVIEQENNILKCSQEYYSDNNEFSQNCINLISEIKSNIDDIYKNDFETRKSDINNIIEKFKNIEESLLKLNNLNNELLNSNKNIIEKSDIQNIAKKAALQVKDEIFGVVNGITLLPRYTFLKESHQETIDFIKENMDMNKIIMKPDRISNLRLSVAQAQNIQGLVLEFGVYSGETINVISDYFKDRKIHGFDSFEGLPEDWNGWSLEKSFFKTNNMPKVKENVELHKGWFDEVLPHFLEEHTEDVAFLHVDCDIYSSAKYVLTALKDRIKPGTIITFDEYFNYPNWKNHEHKAFEEFISETGYKFEYLSIGRDQLTVKMI